MAEELLALGRGPFPSGHEQQFLDGVEGRIFRSVRPVEAFVVLGLGAVRLVKVVIVAPVHDRIRDRLGSVFVHVEVVEDRPQQVLHAPAILHELDGEVLVLAPLQHADGLRQRGAGDIPVEIGLDLLLPCRGERAARCSGPMRSRRCTA